MMYESYLCSPGRRRRSQMPISTGYSTPKHPRARRQLPFGTPKREICSPEPVPMWCPRPPKDPRKRLFTPKRDCYTYEERAALSNWNPIEPPPTPRKPYSFMPNRGMNHGRSRRSLFQSPGCANSAGSSGLYETACESPEASYGTPPLSSYPFLPPPPPCPPAGTMPSPWDADSRRPCKMRATALPGVVKPITNPFSYRDPSEFVSMHDLINQDFLRLGPYPPPPPLAHSTPLGYPEPYTPFKDRCGMGGQFFPTASMFNSMYAGEWGQDEDEYWPDRNECARFYDPRTAVAPYAPKKIRISPWPRNHPAPRC